MKVLDLFSGIGGFSLGLERAGMQTVAFCEIEPYCQKVLAKHWPGVPIHDDITQLDGTQYRDSVDLVCGGFPCQPFSVAGDQRGADDDRHLWPEMLRVIREVQPAWVIGENVIGLESVGVERLWSRVDSFNVERDAHSDYAERTLSYEDRLALGAVCSDLEGIGYAVQTFDIPACGVGAIHRRHRLWIVAHAERPERRPLDQPCGLVQREDGDAQRQKGAGGSRVVGEVGNAADACGERGRANAGAAQSRVPPEPTQLLSEDGEARASDVAAGIEFARDAGNADGSVLEGDGPGGEQKSRSRRGEGEPQGSIAWPTEPPVCGPNDGISDELAFLGGLNEAINATSEIEQTAFLEWKALRAMWEHRELAATSRDLYINRLRDSVSEVSCGASQGEWNLGKRAEETEGLRDLWEAFYAEPFEEAQDLQRRLLKRIGGAKRPKALGSRVDQLRALGNAVVPQIPEMIGRAIVESQHGC